MAAATSGSWRSLRLNMGNPAIGGCGTQRDSDKMMPQSRHFHKEFPSAARKSCRLELTLRIRETLSPSDGPQAHRTDGSWASPAKPHSGLSGGEIRLFLPP